jgi:hypothetical protein
MKIEILGGGCSKCIEVKKSVLQAVSELDINADIETTNDPEIIAGYHALTLPVLVIDGVPQPVSIRMNVSEVTQLLKKAL